MPQGRASIDAEAIEPKRIQLEFGAEAEAFNNISLEFAGRPHQEKSVRSLDATPLGFTDRVFNLCQRLALVEPVENLLRPGFYTKREEVAVRLTHDGKLIHRDGIHPAFAAPLECQL